MITFGKRWLLLLIAVLAVAALTVACGDDDDDDDTTPAKVTHPAGSAMEAIQKKGKIIIGVKYDVPLMGLLDPTTKKVDGFDIAIGKEIAKALGLREDQIEFIEAVSANRIPFLKEDKADLIISTMTITTARKEEIDFSRPYYQAGQSILVKKDNTTIKAVADLNGKNVCSAQGSTSEKNVKEKAPTSNLTSFDVYSKCVTALNDGRVVAVSTDDIILAGFAASDNTLKLVGGQFTVENYGIGIKKGKSDLVKFIDEELADMFKDGRWDKIYDKYLGKVEGFPKASELRAKLPATN